MKTEPLSFGDHSETTVQEKVAYRGGLLTVREDRVRLPNGPEAVREYLMHPGAVLILALLDDGQVVLERQFRYPLRRHMIELPAGKMESNEDPLLTAQRELLEETGYRAAHWEHVFTTHPCVGYSDERIELFLARGLTAGTAQLDDGEFLDVFTLPLREALAWIDRGDITDIKTIAGLLWLARQRGV
jgi:ADP-ribose pyrophosphatase